MKSVTMGGYDRKLGKYSQYISKKLIPSSMVKSPFFTAVIEITGANATNLSILFTNYSWKTEAAVKNTIVPCECPM